MSGEKTALILDYGLGNLFSIERAVRHLGGTPVVSDDPGELSKARRLIIPGVGAFGEGIGNMTRKDLVSPVREFAASGRPVLGICLGMQLLMTESEEMGRFKGLDIVGGKVVMFRGKGQAESGFKIPHYGWNALLMPATVKSWDKTVLEGVKAGDSAYFVHSFYVVPNDPSITLAETSYGEWTFCSAFKLGNIYGCQFHPEKSGPVGLRILGNFLGL